jgi:hypothetical protein
MHFDVIDRHRGGPADVRQPASIAAYARDAARFVPVFVRDRVSLAAFVGCPCHEGSSVPCNERPAADPDPESACNVGAQAGWTSRFSSAGPSLTPSTSHAPTPDAPSCRLPSPAALARAPPQRPAPPVPETGQLAISMARRGEASDLNAREKPPAVAEAIRPRAPREKPIGTPPSPRSAGRRRRCELAISRRGRGGRTPRSPRP